MERRRKQGVPRRSPRARQQLQVFLVCAGLLLIAAVVSRARSSEVVFVFKGLDKNLAILQPMIVPVIGVQVESGPVEIAPNEVLRCESKTRTCPGTVNGEQRELWETVLVCGDRTLVVKAIGFDPR